LESSTSASSALRNANNLCAIDGDLAGGKSGKTHNGRQCIRHHCAAMDHTFNTH
jgi:hypothetical protein